MTGVQFTTDVSGGQLVADALAAAACDSGDVETQRAWLAERHHPYGTTPGASDHMVTAAFVACCLIMLRKLASGGGCCGCAIGEGCSCVCHRDASARPARSGAKTT